MYRRDGEAVMSGKKNPKRECVDSIEDCCGPETAQTRIAVIGIIVEDTNSAEAVNSILHQYGSYIIGRMGLPYEKKKVSIISVVVDAPQDVISALSGKLGRLRGISSKALYSKA